MSGSEAYPLDLYGIPVVPLMTHINELREERETKNYNVSESDAIVCK